MSLSLLTNVASLQAQVNVTNTQSLIDNSIQRLSSGLRINNASDDPAGLAISSRLTAEIGGLIQAQRNADDGISMIQTADGGFNEINSLLTRMRELAVESSNGGTLGTSDRAALNTEYSALISEIDRIVNVTSYNGTSLIDGTLSASTSFQVGAFNSTNDVISLSISSSSTSTLGVSSTDVTSSSDATSALSAIDSAISTIASSRASIGAAQSRLSTAIDNLQVEYVNLSAANSRIRDVDVASETALLTSNQILLQAGISVLSQANQQPAAALSLISGGR